MTGGILEGGDDPWIRAAVADVRVLVHRGDDGFGGRMWRVVQQRNAGHDHPARAVPALKRFVCEERLLNGMQATPLLESFDCDDRATLELRGLRLARLEWLPVHENGARAALPLAASVLRAGQVERVAQDGQQRV